MFLLPARPVGSPVFASAVSPQVGCVLGTASDLPQDDWRSFTIVPGLTPLFLWLIRAVWPETCHATPLAENHNSQASCSAVKMITLTVTVLCTRMLRRSHLWEIKEETPVNPLYRPEKSVWKHMCKKSILDICPSPRPGLEPGVLDSQRRLASHLEYCTLTTRLSRLML